MVVLLCGLATERVQGQEAGGDDVALAMQQALVRTIASAERSVVAIARVDKTAADDTFGLEFRPDPFGRRATAFAAPAPTDADFIPKEYATGVVVDRQGLILTACHVLGEDSEYYVTTHDRRVYAATVKGADPRSDMAVLSIQATDLEPVIFGDAATLKKGQIVVALGNPYAIARDGQVSASWGIVSNLARKAPLVTDEAHPSGKSTLHHFGTLIQTDAKLNLGTSGGPLLDIEGRMVGLTTSLAATTGYEQAAGYAFPVDDTFRRVVETLKRGREVEYGFLGISPVNLPLGVQATGIHGTRVDWVVAGTPAERFGIQPGDIITSVNGKPIHDADGLILQVGKLSVDSPVRLSLIRAESIQDVDVALTKYRVRGNQRKIVTAPPPGWRGIQVDYLSADPGFDERAGLGGPAFDDGVIVTSVDKQTQAWEVGMRPGIMVSHVERQGIKNPKEFHEAVSGKSGAVKLRTADSNGENRATTVIAGS